MHFRAMNSDVEITSIKNCTETALLYLKLREAFCYTFCIYLVRILYHAVARELAGKWEVTGVR